VGGCNLCLHPYVSLQFSRLGVLSPQGMCKSFDRDGRYNSSNYNLLVAVILCYSLDIVH
jgi:fatty acid synthase